MSTPPHTPTLRPLPNPSSPAPSIPTPFKSSPIPLLLPQGSNSHLQLREFFALLRRRSVHLASCGEGRVEREPRGALACIKHLHHLGWGRGGHEDGEDRTTKNKERVALNPPPPTKKNGWKHATVEEHHPLYVPQFRIPYTSPKNKFGKKTIPRWGMPFWGQTVLTG